MKITPIDPNERPFDLDDPEVKHWMAERIEFRQLMRLPSGLLLMEGEDYHFSLKYYAKTSGKGYASPKTLTNQRFLSQVAARSHFAAQLGKTPEQIIIDTGCDHPPTNPKIDPATLHPFLSRGALLTWPFLFGNAFYIAQLYLGTIDPGYSRLNLTGWTGNREEGLRHHRVIEAGFRANQEDKARRLYELLAWGMLDEILMEEVL